MRISVTLTNVFDDPIKNADGSWTIDLLGVEINRKDAEVLEKLFPDTMSAVDRLLQKQALLNSIK